MKKAITTLVIGKRYEENFERYCRKAWSEYAHLNGFDLVVITDRLDTSKRANSRSPAWQKLLVLSHQDLSNYDQVVWIDSDVMINPKSPDICMHVPVEKIGAVDEYASPSKEDHPFYLEKTYNYWSENNVPFINSPTSTDFHRDFGLDGEFDSVVQTGVMVFSPRYHRELLEHVYHSYEDKGEAFYNYEMRPLSYEILKEDMAFWLPPRFNLLWIFWKQFHYPFLEPSQSSLDKNFRKVLRKVKLDPYQLLLKKCVTTTFWNSYFLHFAGTAHEMRYVDPALNT